MAGKQAKILSDQQTRSLLVFASSTRNPHRNHLIVLLSLKAGLRAGEIAKLTWDMVLGPTGEIGLVIELRDCAAKKNSGRLHSNSPEPAHRPGRLAQDDDRHRPDHPVRARRPDDAGQHRQLVRDCLSGGRP